MQANRLPRWIPLEAVEVVFTPHLRAGQILPNVHGGFLVGAGTDLNMVLFKANLTPYDLSFLRDVKVNPGV